MAEDTITPAAPKPRKPAAPKAPKPLEANTAVTPTPIEPIADTKPTPGQQLKDGAAKLTKQATDRAREYVDEGKARAGGALDEVSKLMGDAANTVDEKLGPQYGQYARSAAEGIASFSEGLKGKELEDLIADARGFVKKSPAVAIGVAAALGFVVARLVKAGLDAADEAADGEEA